MSKFKTITENGKTYNSFIGKLKILAEKDGWRQKAELWLLNDITNNNDWRYERLEEHKNLFAKTPILVAYVGDKIGDGHNFREVSNPDGSVIASFMSSTAERIVGFFDNDSDIRIEEKDGKKWIVGIGYIWQWYAQELVEKIKKQGLDGMSISIETLVDEMHKEGSTEVFTKYQILGTTILGDDVAPAVTGANIRALSALGVDKIREETLRVASMQEQKQKNPQSKTKKENKVTVMKLKDLKNGKFNGFRVVGVDGEKVALLSLDKNDAFVSTAVQDNGEIVEGVKTAVNATVVFGEGENEVKVALDAVIEDLTAENAELKAELNSVKEGKEAVEKSLKTMQDAEMARRKEAVKNAVREQLAKNRENSLADIADNECDDLLTDEKVAKYSEMEEDGKFVGDEKARCDVDARCMSIIREQNKAKMQKAFAWEIPKTNSDENNGGDDVQNLIDKMTNQ
nr:MAG TPA: hypothetical protein [Caudoviricetes sp.]